jgi:HEPN domain-containing protein
MDNGHTDGLKSTLRLYRLPEEASTQQPLIERAEEDLLCVLSLYRQGACGYSALVTVCFLLHQALEKWLKAFIAVQGFRVSTKTHDLYNRFQAVEEVDPAFGDIRSKLEIAPEIMAHEFPGNLRYNETPPDIEQYVEVLIKAAFATRKLVKRALKRRLEEME